MTPFPKPLAADYLGQPVAIIATSDAEYMAIDGKGQTIIEGHALFVVIDGEINEAIWHADSHLTGS